MRRECRVSYLVVEVYDIVFDWNIRVEVLHLAIITVGAPVKKNWNKILANRVQIKVNKLAVKEKIRQEKKIRQERDTAEKKNP